MNKKIIRKAHIITMNDASDIIPHVTILIENGKIQLISPDFIEDDEAEVPTQKACLYCPVSSIRTPMYQ